MKKLILALILGLCVGKAEMSLYEVEYRTGYMLGYFTTAFCLNYEPEEITNEVHFKNCVNAVLLVKDIKCESLDNLNICTIATNWLLKAQRIAG